MIGCLFIDVVPVIHRQCRNDSRLRWMVATASLFACVDKEFSEPVPQAIHDGITQACIPTHPDIPQSIAQVPLAAVCHMHPKHAHDR